MVIPISMRERFYGLPNPLGGTFAPSTIGAPHYTYATDYKEFMCDKTQKAAKKAWKKEHKKELMEAYPDGVGKRLNIPSRSLLKIIIN
jgi:hypothetical protein